MGAGTIDSPGALQAAFDQHYVKLVRLGALLLGSGKQDGEDLAQESFVRAAKAIPRLQEDEVGPYLRQTLLNVFRNRTRRLRVERRHASGEEMPPRDGLPFEERQVLWNAVRGLTPKQRACIVLRYYEGLTESEAARLLGCSIGTVKSQSHNAIEHLRKELTDES